MDWERYAEGLAARVSYPESDWWAPICATPRHALVERWFTPSRGGWEVVDGPSDEEAWVKAAHSDVTLVTKVGSMHADHAETGVIYSGRPTSSSTLPSLVISMLRHGRVHSGVRLLDVATGSGYSAAVACARLGDQDVTTLDVDPYLTQAAADRLGRIGWRPAVVTADAEQELPGPFDRIVSMVSMPRIPATWLRALAGGGRLVTTIANTGLIITADKTDDGGARGRVEWDRASFMATRSSDDYPPLLDKVFARALEDDGDVTTSSFPVINVMQAWDLWSMLTLTEPGIEHRTGVADDGGAMSWMLHADGSWSRAHTMRDNRITTVHQGGPRRLYDLLDAIRWQWVEHGELPVYGARVVITPEGETTLSHGHWSVKL